MKKFLLFICILFTSMCCTACINNLAIQELNQIGKSYLDKGDYQNAISRFQSSLDLDENIFESRYNLGVAYISVEDYPNAMVNLKRAIEINPTSADAHYSYAVALENDGLAFEENPYDDVKESDKVQYTTDDIKAKLELVIESIDMYKKYAELNKDADDINTVVNHIRELSDKVTSYQSKYAFNDLRVGE